MEAGFESLASILGFLLALTIQLIDLLHEEQIGDLLNGGEGIRDAPGPETVP